MADNVKLQHKRVFGSRIFQQLAELFAANDIPKLCERQELIKRLSPTYSAWLVLPAIKSGYVSGLKMLRRETWEDIKVCKDAKIYAELVGNSRALGYIAEMTARTEAEMENK